MKRTIEPEWLDELPPYDPGALGSRRDIGRLNRLMGHAQTLHKLLNSAIVGPPRRVIELGAGGGEFMLELATMFSEEWRGAEILLVDCKDVVTEETRAGFAGLGCNLKTITADVSDWLEKTGDAVDIIIANLFLHQFSDEQLRQWFALAAHRTRLFAACEPRRAPGPFALSRMVGLIGCNSVTRHDAPISVKAGFLGQEISALWPKHGDWHLRERDANFFSHTFLAQLESP